MSPSTLVNTKIQKSGGVGASHSPRRVQKCIMGESQNGVKYLILQGIA